MSCHDNDDVEPLVQLNKYRAKEIKGHNALWGDFKISLNYIDNSLDLGFITDRNQDTIGRLNSSQVLMLVPSNFKIRKRLINWSREVLFR